jgi:hypothetical protein
MSSALKCAYLVGDITNYCLLSIEIMGKNILLESSQKSLVQSNLIKVLANEIPRLDEIREETSVLLKWQDELKKSQLSQSLPKVAINTADMEKSVILADHKLIPAHVSGMVPFVECKAQFASLTFNSNQMIELFVYVRVDCVDRIQFNKFYIRFNLAYYNQFCVLEKESNSLLNFEPNRVYKLKFSFLCQKQDIGKELEISSLSLELGDREVRVLLLHWKGDCRNALAYENQTIMSFARLNSSLKSNDDDSAAEWNSIEVVPCTNILSRQPNIQLKLEHSMPIFVDEYYAIRVAIENKEDSPIENIT